MADLIQFRRDTAERWAAANPVLAEGELGLVLGSSNQYKVGDGVTPWNSLPIKGFNGNIFDELGDNYDAVISQAGLTLILRNMVNNIQHHIDDLQHHIDDLQQYVDDNLHSLDKTISAIKKDVGTTEDEADKEGSLHAQINYLKQNGGSCVCEEILEYNKALVTALTPDSTSEEISLAFVPIGAKDKTTPVLPKVNDLLVTNGSVKEMAQFVNVTDYLTPKGTHRYTLLYQDGSILHTIQMLGFASVHSVEQNDLADFSEVELVPKTI